MVPLPLNTPDVPVILLVIHPFTAIAPLLVTVPAPKLKTKRALVVLAELNELAEVPEMVYVVVPFTVRLAAEIVVFTGCVKLAPIVKVALTVNEAAEASVTLALDIVRLLKTKVVPVNVWVLPPFRLTSNTVPAPWYILNVPPFVVMFPPTFIR